MAERNRCWCAGRGVVLLLLLLSPPRKRLIEQPELLSEAETAYPTGGMGADPFARAALGCVFAGCSTAELAAPATSGRPENSRALGGKSVSQPSWILAPGFPTAGMRRLPPLRPMFRSDSVWQHFGCSEVDLVRPGIRAQAEATRAHAHRSMAPAGSLWEHRCAIFASGLACGRPIPPPLAIR